MISAADLISRMIDIQEACPMSIAYCKNCDVDFEKEQSKQVNLCPDCVLRQVKMEARDKHVKWCKTRAMELVSRGDLLGGVTSMMSDMDKRDDTKLGPALTPLGLIAAISATKGDREFVERFITGFN